MLTSLAIAGILLGILALSSIGRLYYVRKRRKEMDEQVEEARETLLEMQALMKQPGWARLAAAAAKHIEARKNEVLLKPTEDTASENYMKGEIQGIALFVEIPRQLIDMNKDILDTARRLEEEGAE